MPSTVVNGKSKTKIHTSIQGLSGEVREQQISRLQQSLADIFDLKSQTKQAHWNVKGPHFHALHLMFDTFSGGLENYIDVVAERITALGGYVHGTARQSVKASSVQEYPNGITSGEDHLSALIDRYAKVGGSLREAAAKSDEIGDLASSDMYNDIIRDMDQWLWFMEAHMQG